MSQTHLADNKRPRMTYDERVCARCMGHRHLCGISPCPIVMRAKALANIDGAVSGLSLEGASPPSVFVGSHGYPKVLAGPLVPPSTGPEAAMMERPDLWLTKSLDEILALRFRLVRTKQPLRVDAAVDPPRTLAETQTMTLSETPVDSEAELLKKPQFTTVLSQRTLPVGPSAPLDGFRLEDNPQVPRPVDRVTSDTDLGAGQGVLTLFDEGIRQEHITRLLSVGLLGVRKHRRLVPTEWSITAVDDIVGRELHGRILRMPWLNDHAVAWDSALGNTVVILFTPSAWQFEALECWLGSIRPQIISDHEWFKGRKDYARSVTGAYYATRLPVLEYLASIKRQAGVIVFMEVDPQRWVPLGVWRFREIARRALARRVGRFTCMDDALEEVGRHLRNPIERWLEASHQYRESLSQTRLTDFF